MFQKYLGYSIAVIALCATVSACKTTEPPKPTGTALTGAQLQAIYASGKPVVSSGKSLESGNSWKLARDGKDQQMIKVANGDFSDTGTYRIADNMICSKWKKIRDGAETCSTMYVLPDGTYEAADEKGVKIAVFTIEKSG
jgi:hypothetical protein